jgi:hypothetical protein
MARRLLTRWVTLVRDYVGRIIKQKLPKSDKIRVRVAICLNRARG